MLVKQKINVLLYGNCQVKLIVKILKKLHSDILDITHLTQVQLINESDVYFQSMEAQIINADIIITQNIKSPELDPFLKLFTISSATNIILIDSLYAPYYHPELIPTKIIPNFKARSLHDKNIIKAIAKDVRLEDFLINDPFYDSDFYSDDIYKKSISESIAKLEARKKALEKKIKSFSSSVNKNIKIEHISILPFINKILYKENLPSWSDHNHPNLPVYEWLYKQITDKIDIISDSEFNNIFDYSTFQKISFPSYTSTIKHMKLSDNNNILYNLGSNYRNKTRKQYVEDIWSFYLSLDQSKIKSVYQGSISCN